MKVKSKSFKTAILAALVAVLMVFATVAFVLRGGASLIARADDASQEPDQVEPAEREPVTPSSLDPMKRIGVDNEMTNPNFADGSASPRSEYGGTKAGWSFTHQDELSGKVEEYSTFERVEITDAVEGMGRTAGTGNLIDTALEITINKDNQSTLDDSATYSPIDALLYGTRASEPVYCSLWIKAEQDMWFDVGFSYSAAGDKYAVYFDLGRRFFVKAGEWTEIGKDDEGNYLPFRAKVTDTGCKRGTGSDPTADNSNCATDATYAKEDTGDTQMGIWYRENWSQVWSCLRFYAYAADLYNGTNGIGAPAATHGLSAGDKYRITGFNFWGVSNQPPADVNYDAETIELNKTAATLAVGETVELTATVGPDNATDKSVYWSSSDTTVADVDQDGKVTAKKAGTCTITAEANGGAGVEASCAITVTAPSSGDNDQDNDNNQGDNNGGATTDSEKKGCKSEMSAVGFGAIGLATLLGGVALIAFRKKETE